MTLIMKFQTSYNQILILVLFLVAVVQTSRVIRAAPGIKTTGQYMVALTLDTSHERFETIADKVQSQSLSSEIRKLEGQFAKVIVAKLSEAEAHKVSLNTHTHTHTHTNTHTFFYNLANLFTIIFSMKISS